MYNYEYEQNSTVKAFLISVIFTVLNTGKVRALSPYICYFKYKINSSK